MKKNNLKFFILDVDGVMTDGKFIYSEKGKILKSFGPDDHDALSLLNRYIKIQFVTGDKTGFKISKKRIVDDMKFPLDLVSTVARVDWIKDKFGTENTIYMGDGIFDHYVMKEVAYSIAPNNADANCKKHAKYITKRNGGERAVAEACLHLMKKFFKKYNPNKKLNKNIKLSGKWKT